jgi:hypothetical protein
MNRTAAEHRPHPGAGSARSGLPGSEDQAMRQAMMRAATLTMTLVMWILAGCTVSFFGRADSGIEVEADYGSRHEESGDDRHRSGIRRGDSDPDEDRQP